MKSLLLFFVLALSCGLAWDGYVDVQVTNPYKETGQELKNVMDAAWKELPLHATVDVYYMVPPAMTGSNKPAIFCREGMVIQGRDETIRLWRKDMGALYLPRATVVMIAKPNWSRRVTPLKYIAFLQILPWCRKSRALYVQPDFAAPPRLKTRPMPTP